MSDDVRDKLPQSIRLWGVKQNNLKNIDVEVPLGSFTVVCGPSGSGKSSLAFETLYAEGQRRYIESLSNYTKQFLNKAPKPDVDEVENIPPALALEQKNGVKSSRSSVGTTTEVLDYLRLLYEKMGQVFCPDHKIILSKDSPSSGARKVLSVFEGQRGYVMAPLWAADRSVAGKELLGHLIKEGYQRIYLPKQAEKPSVVKAVGKKLKALKPKKKTKAVKAESETHHPSITAKQAFDGAIFSKEDMGEIVELKDPRFEKKGLPDQDFFLVIDRISFSQNEEGRLVDSLSQAYQASTKYNKSSTYSRAEVLTTDGSAIRISDEYSCSVCEYHFPQINSALFSFNSPVGACDKCNGFGNILTVDEAKVIPNPELSLNQGAIAVFEMPSGKADRKEMMKYVKKAGIDPDLSWKDLPKLHREALWKGNDDFFGVLGLFDYLETKKYKMHVRVFLARHKSPQKCSACKGTRLKPIVEQVTVRGKSISSLSGLPIADLMEFLKTLKLTEYEKEMSHEIFQQLSQRLEILCKVGVGYLSLDRATKTLSGGEYQRIMLSNQLGMGLSQTLYVLDEPTIGLHPRDNERLISVMKGLQELGNTLVIVEHDHDVILNSTNIIEMGPGSGHLGGKVVYSGPSEDFLKDPNSLTAAYLRATAALLSPAKNRPVDVGTYKYKLEINGVHGNNLKNIDVKIPLNRLVTITGVSGSGKSSLVSNTIYPIVARHLNVEYLPSHPVKSVKGLDHIKNVLFIDQSPVGKTARSNPATYLKVFDTVREVMSKTDDAKLRGYTPSSFSLNVDGGRCPVCSGLGYEVIDMVFMDDILIPCEACDAKKYRPELLEVRYKGKNIHEILSMTVAEAMEFFVNHPNIYRPLSVLREVGLEYITLGQPASTLSGGESQRLKIAREFNTSKQKATLYILDEPTTGLHFREVDLLLKVLNRLVDSGGSVLVIEHNLEVIRNSDYVIDLGPEAGEHGGDIVAEGSPEEIMKVKNSHTGQYLKDYLKMFEGRGGMKKSTPVASSPTQVRQ